MSLTIWKFVLHPGEPTVSMPVGSKILTAHEQNGDVCIWAEVDPEAAMEDRRFAVYGIGHEMPDDPGSYIGTVMLIGGRFVFHVYALV